MNSKMLNKIAWFLHPENLEDLECAEDYVKKAKHLYKMVEKSVRRDIIKKFKDDPEVFINRYLHHG